ncbi:MAG: hypothetical protein ACI9OJ_003322 [Myxococcota bacterium]
MSDYFIQWVAAFVWTLAVELPVYGAILRSSFSRWWHPTATAFVVNAITHPMLWALFPYFDGEYGTKVLVAEAVVWTVEAVVVVLVLRSRGRQNAVVLGISAAFLANGLSTVFGLYVFPALMGS